MEDNTLDYIEQELARLRDDFRVATTPEKKERLRKRGRLANQIKNLFLERDTETDSKKKELIDLQLAEKLKEYASEKYGGHVCYWEYCVKKWDKDLYPFCSQEHRELFDKQNPTPSEKRRLTVSEAIATAKAYGEGKLHANALRQDPRVEHTQKLFPDGELVKR